MMLKTETYSVERDYDFEDSPFAVGGFGTIYQASSHNSSNSSNSSTIYAIKRIDISSGANYENYMKERKNIERINASQHDNLLPILCIYENHPWAFYVMHKCHVSMYRYSNELKKNKDHWPGIYKLLAQIVEGINALHELNIIHRDIKPKNILITRDNVVKIIDFGNAKETDFEITEQSKVPTESYLDFILAHFYLRKCKNLKLSPKYIDIWGLSATIFSILFGAKKWDDAFAMALANEGKSPSTHDIWSFYSFIEEFYAEIRDTKQYNRTVEVYPWLQTILSPLESMKIYNLETITSSYSLIKKSKKSNTNKNLLKFIINVPWRNVDDERIRNKVKLRNISGETEQNKIKEQIMNYFTTIYKGQCTQFWTSKKNWHPDDIDEILNETKQCRDKETKSLFREGFRKLILKMSSLAITKKVKSKKKNRKRIRMSMVSTVDNDNDDENNQVYVKPKKEIKKRKICK